MLALDCWISVVVVGLFGPRRSAASNLDVAPSLADARHILQRDTQDRANDRMQAESYPTGQLPSGPPRAQPIPSFPGEPSSRANSPLVPLTAERFCARSCQARQARQARTSAVTRMDRRI